MATVSLPPPGYPDWLETEEVDRAGNPLSVRPIVPGDAAGLVEFHEGLSPETSYRRYFSSHRHLIPAEVHHLTEVDYIDRLALLALRDGRIVGVARYDRLPEADEAEVAFVVTDAEQGRGIGSLLLDRLATAARSRGIRRLRAQTLVGNTPMLAVFCGSGHPVRLGTGGGVVDVVIDLGTPGTPA